MNKSVSGLNEYEVQIPFLNERHKEDAWHLYTKPQSLTVSVSAVWRCNYSHHAPALLTVPYTAYAAVNSPDGAPPVGGLGRNGTKGISYLDPLEQPREAWPN